MKHLNEKTVGSIIGGVIGVGFISYLLPNSQIGSFDMLCGWIFATIYFWVMCKFDEKE